MTERPNDIHIFAIAYTIYFGTARRMTGCMCDHVWTILWEHLECNAVQEAKKSCAVLKKEDSEDKKRRAGFQQTCNARSVKYIDNAELVSSRFVHKSLDVPLSM